MRNAEKLSIGRRHLDNRLASANDPMGQSIVNRLARPQKGWIKAIREAIGMSSAQLASRIGIAQQVLYKIESSEAAGTIKLETLERVAAALNCRLVYALIPNEPLEEMVRKRVLDVASQQLGAVEHTMRLENQAIDDDYARRRQLDALMSEIDLRRLWD
jgi:predicted DNA-binding mobile mystery protein A